MQTKEIVADKNLLSSCGRYCGACVSYLEEKCLGCSKDKKTLRCKIMSCNQKKGYSSCAKCEEFSDVTDCKKFNSIINRIFGLIFRLDRKACISRIREIGSEEYVREMAGKKLSGIKR